MQSGHAEGGFGTALDMQCTLLDERHHSVWIWAASLHTDAADAVFLYGCCAPCRRPRQSCATESLPIVGPEQAALGTLIIRWAVIETARANNLIQALSTGRAELSSVLEPDAPAVDVTLSRRIISDVLGHSSATIDAYLTLPSLDELTRPTDRFKAVLSLLQAQLGMPFEGNYAAHIGNFEVVHLAEWLEGQRPFAVEALQPDQPEGASDRHRLIVTRAQPFSGDAHVAHIQCFSGKDTTLDRLFFLPAGDTEPYAIVAPESIDGFEFRLFSADGRILLHKETTHFLRQIQSVMTMVGRSVELQDKLSAAAQSFGRKPTIVQAQSSMRSKIGLDGAEDRWRDHAERLKRFTDENFAPRSRDRWFPRSVESELAVIEHINTILHGGTIIRAILVDPFFGADALVRLATRLSSTDIELTIITCLRDRDKEPDTDKPLSTARSALSVLEEAVKNVHAIINPKLKIMNLERQSGDQVFHDRYLLAYHHEGPPIIYMLSNSINRMAGKYSFCMTVLAEDITRDVQTYIEGLSLNKDISHPAQPNVTFAWPPKA